MATGKMLRMRPIGSLLLLPLFLAVAACASDSSGRLAENTPDGPTAAGNAERFVFGALPGRPVVYWIHTDW